MFDSVKKKKDVLSADFNYIKCWIRSCFFIFATYIFII